MLETQKKNMKEKIKYILVIFYFLLYLISKFSINLH